MELILLILLIGRSSVQAFLFLSLVKILILAYGNQCLLFSFSLRSVTQDKERALLSFTLLTRVTTGLWKIIQIYRIVGHFGFGAVATLLTTEIAKYQVGRLRPYFLTACNIDLTDELCKDGNFYKFVTEYTCNGTDPSTGEETHDVMEARKSFLSGHSSFSFYTAAFLILYLQARLYTTRPVMGVHRIQRGLVAKVLFRGGRIARPFIQFSLFGLAFWICLTRISDYKHHPGDVAIGILVGVVWAILLHAYTLELFTKPLSFWSTSRMNEHALSRGKLPEMVGAKSSNVDQPDSANRSRSRTIL